MNELTHLDLFSGYGGFSIAAERAGYRTIAFSEVAPFQRRILKSRWPNVRNVGDVRNAIGIRANLVTGGPPCQPASHAGKRLGEKDDRWLWQEAIAVVEQSGCEAFVFENPLGILSLDGGMAVERVLSGLEGVGYSVAPVVIPACAVNAKIERYRVWFIGFSNRNRKSTRAVHDETPLMPANGNGSQSECSRLQGWATNGAQRQEESRAQQLPGHVFLGVGDAVSAARVWRAANGPASRLDAARNRAIGNGIVWQVAYQILKGIARIEKNDSSEG